MEKEEMPYTQLHELYGETYRKIVYEALIKAFNPKLQKDYYVSGIAMMPDDKVVIRLERKIFPD